MNKKMVLRPLDVAMNDSYSTAELYAVFESQVFGKSKSMDVPLLRETVKALDDRMDDEVAPHKEFVWQKIVHRILNMQQPFVLGLSRKGFAILIVALVLLITTIALALTNWNAIVEWVYRLEKQESRVEQWTLEQKLSLADSLREQGYDMSALPDLNGMTADEKNATLSDWLKVQFDGEVNANHYNLMTRLNGYFEDWSYADMAWYSQMLLDAGEVWDGRFISTIPSTDIQKHGDAVLALTDQALHHAFNGTSVDADSLTAYLLYGYQYPDESTHLWCVHYRDQDLFLWFEGYVTDTEPLQMLSDPYTAPLPEQFNAALEENSRRNEERQRTLQELESERGLLVTWTYEQQNEWNPTHYGVPSPEDITQEDAYAIARQVYCDTMGVSADEVNRLYCHSYFIIDDEKPYYDISFSYDQESRNLVEFSISIYHDGEIRNISIGSNG
ncbi:MAG: hypothetical protein IKO52_12845 [Clostridia bacterium]|nr:hypothetical protein [Clostridia bacterium]